MEGADSHHEEHDGRRTAMSRRVCQRSCGSPILRAEAMASGALALQFREGRRRSTVATGEGRREKVFCDPSTTWSLQKNMISRNEPKFDQAGVDKFGKQSQKRSQVAAADTTWPRLRARHDMLASRRLVPPSAPSDSACGGRETWEDGK